jgi:hypothetical protein
VSGFRRTSVEPATRFTPRDSDSSNGIEHAFDMGHINQAGVAVSRAAKLDAAQAALDREEAAVTSRLPATFINEVTAQAASTSTPSTRRTCWSMRRRSERLPGRSECGMRRSGPAYKMRRAPDVDSPPGVVEVAFASSFQDRSAYRVRVIAMRLLSKISDLPCILLRRCVAGRASSMKMRDGSPN